jgi:hypothetical protein
MYLYIKYSVAIFLEQFCIVLGSSVHIGSDEDRGVIPLESSSSMVAAERRA